MNKQKQNSDYYTKKVAQEGTKGRPIYTGFRNSLHNRCLLSYK